MKYKICSLFSGIGGIELGAMKALGEEKSEVVFASEIDKYAKQTYEYIYETKIEGDITEVNKKEIPDHDILVAGFPCQAFSQAGRREGFKDTRGTMFFEVEKVIEQKNPKIVFLENVTGLLTHDQGRTLEIILEKISEKGYVVDFKILDSKNFGVPQSRKRIYIVAIKNGEKEEEWKIEKKKSAEQKRRKKLNENKKINKMNFDFPTSKGEPKTIIDILQEEKVEEKFFLKEDKTRDLIKRLMSTNFKIEKELFLIDDQGRKKKVIKPMIISPTIRAEMHGNEPKIVEIKRNELNMLGRLEMKGNDSIRRVYHPMGLCPTLTTMGGGHREPKIMIHEEGQILIRKITPKETLRLQAYPDTYYEKMKELKISDSQIYRMAGNSVTVSTIEAIFEKIKKVM